MRHSTATALSLTAMVLWLVPASPVLAGQRGHGGPPPQAHANTQTPPAGTGAGAAGGNHGNAGGNAGGNHGNTGGNAGGNGGNSGSNAGGNSGNAGGNSGNAGGNHGNSGKHGNAGGSDNAGGNSGNAGDNANAGDNGKTGNNGKAGDNARGNSSTNTSFVSRIERNPQLSSRLTALLPSGMSLETAAQGFKNQGQFIAALHVSHNLDIPFDQLKTEMTGTNHRSLGQAIETLKPSADGDKEAKSAEGQAKADEKSASASKSTRNGTADDANERD
jgi:hypothetical protein